MRERKYIFLFDSFGVNGSKNFIIQNNRKMINRILFGTEKIKKRDKYALTLGIKFSTPNYSKFTQKKTDES